MMETDQLIYDNLDKLIELTQKFELNGACSLEHSVSRKNVEFKCYNLCRTNEQKVCDFITFHDHSTNPLWTINGNVVSKYELDTIVGQSLKFWKYFVLDNYCLDTNMLASDCDCYECNKSNREYYAEMMAEVV